LVLRIHFTGEDLAKVRLASRPDPLWETVLTLFRLRFHPTGTPLDLQRWRRDALGRSDRSTLELLMALTPGGYYPDFLTPFEASTGLEAGLDAVMSTGKERLRTEIGRLCRPDRRLPHTVQLLGRGDGEAMHRLGHALRTHHQTVVEPYWDKVLAHIEADRAMRSRAWLDGGCEGLLNSYRPMMRWQFPVLEVDFPVEQDLHLEGRGLLLVPSYFSSGMPDTLFDRTLEPVLVYPVQHDLKLAGQADPQASAECLAALIGSTRAWVLGAIEEGCTTTELARRVGVNTSSISQHTSVLRDARLIRTTRVGKAVLHTLTPLGESLLQA
jgi:DNA-binding transcriptional ArsR family regulator